MLISKVDELAVLPHVVYKVLEISESTDAPASDLEKAITVDPGFSSKVLVLANSAAFGLPKRVTSIREAVMFVGYRGIRNLALTVGIFDLFVGKTDRESLRRRAWWRHSVDTAVCCRWLARESGTGRAEEAYTCGLLHLIGKTLLDRFGSEGYDRVEDLQNAGMTDSEAEFEVYGCDHADVALAASRKWGLPEDLGEGLAYKNAESQGTLCALTALASSIAYHAKGVDTELPIWALGVLSLTPEQAELLTERGKEAITAAQSHG